MDVFISWSGERSRSAAEALRNWLPRVINAIKPWLSVADIDKGARWGTDVATRLENAKAGIICLTPNNLHSDWILFEAGALSKTLQNTFVCPFLIDLEPSDVKPPLAQFQATKAVRDDVLKLLKTLNGALSDGALPEGHLEEAFDVWWPKLKSQMDSLPPEDSKAKPHRPDRELLEEILALARNQSRPPATGLPNVQSRPTQDDVAVASIVQVIREVLQAKGHPMSRITWSRFGRLSNRGRKMTQYAFEVLTEAGKTFSIVVPDEATPAKWPALVRRQVRAFLDGDSGGPASAGGRNE